MSDLAALQNERLGYVRRGLDARVKAVDASIKALGGDVLPIEPPVEVEAPEALPPNVEHAVAAKPKGRRS